MGYFNNRLNRYCLLWMSIHLEGYLFKAGLSSGTHIFCNDNTFVHVHVNVYENGYICLDILKERYTPN